MSENSESVEAFCFHALQIVITRYFHVITTKMEYFLFYINTNILLIFLEYEKLYKVHIIYMWIIGIRRFWNRGADEMYDADITI